MESCNFFDGLITRVKSLQGEDSVRKFAMKIGETQQSVDKYLKRETNPPITFLMSVATKFNVSTDWLLGLQPQQQTQKGGNQIPSRLTDRLDEIKVNAEKTTESINALQCAIDKLKKTI